MSDSLEEGECVRRESYLGQHKREESLARQLIAEIQLEPCGEQDERDQRAK